MKFKNFGNSWLFKTNFSTFRKCWISLWFFKVFQRSIHVFHVEFGARSDGGVKMTIYSQLTQQLTFEKTSTKTLIAYFSAPIGPREVIFFFNLLKIWLGIRICGLEQMYLSRWNKNAIKLWRWISRLLDKIEKKFLVLDRLIFYCLFNGLG